MSFLIEAADRRAEIHAVARTIREINDGRESVIKILRFCIDSLKSMMN